VAAPAAAADFKKSLRFMHTSFLFFGAPYARTSCKAYANGVAFLDQRRRRFFQAERMNSAASGFNTGHVSRAKRMFVLLIFINEIASFLSYFLLPR